MARIMYGKDKNIGEAAQVLKDDYQLDVVQTITVLQSAGYSGWGGGGFISGGLD